jgi:hypothetical protein
VSSEKEWNLLAVEVDVDLRLRGVGAGGEAPAADRVLCGGGEKGVTGLNLGGGDLSVWLNGDQKYNFAADVHASGEFRVGGWDARNDGAWGGCDGGGAESEASDEDKRAQERT